MSRVFFCPKCGAYLPEAAELCDCGSPIVPGTVPPHESHPEEPVGPYGPSAEASLIPSLATSPSPISDVVAPESLGADTPSKTTPATIVALAIGLVVVLLTVWLVRDRLFSFGGKVDNPSAGSATRQDVDSSAQQPSQGSSAPLMIENQFLVDTYLGTIGDKDFKLFLEKVHGERVEGHDVAGTSRRPVTGRIVSKRLEPTGLGGHYTVFKLILNEPGDDEWDGEFTLDLWISDVGRHGEGRWKSFNGRLDRAVTVKDRSSNGDSLTQNAASSLPSTATATHPAARGDTLPSRDPMWVLAVGASPSQSEAEKEISHYRSYGFRTGVLWIPDYSSLSGAQMWLEYVGPYGYADFEAARTDLARLKRYRASAYGIKVDHSGRRETLR